MPGVADIVSFGGEIKTFEVSVNPQQLINYNITSLELYDAIAKSNINVGGDVITKSSQAYVVRGIGLINDIDEIRNIVVKNIKGTPILVKNLAKVHESSCDNARTYLRFMKKSPHRWEIKKQST